MEKVTVKGDIFPGHFGYSVVVLKGEIYLMSGNKVWKSGDGTTWKKVIGSGAKFKSADTHSALIFNDAIYVVVGSKSNTSELNDVWKSNDADAWKKVIGSGDNFYARADHSSAVLNDNIYVLGGFSQTVTQSTVDGTSEKEVTYNYFNDVWKGSLR